MLSKPAINITANSSVTAAATPQTLPTEPILALRDVGKDYRSLQGLNRVLDNINLEIRHGEFLAIIGFSGAGKSTLVNLMAGLIHPDRGQVLLHGKPINKAGPDRGVVFQNYSLLPWLTVFENVALAVNHVCKQLTPKQKRERVEYYLNMVKLDHALERYPAQLSGGMRQRVAVARALAMQPKILLLDEPLSALDALTRASLQDEIVELWRRENMTVVLITNDVDEGLLMADRLIPLTPGPAATLGPTFKIALPRPRERSSINYNAAFKQLRKSVTEYLLAARQNARTQNQIEQSPSHFNLPSPAWILSSSPLSESERARVDRFVELYQVGKTFSTPRGPLKVVENFDLKIKKGEFISLIGHSGCGKSTVLSMLAGLSDVSEGGIVLDAKEIAGAGPDRGIVFQSPSLAPWLTAFENVALAVNRVFANLSVQERREIVELNLARVGLSDVAHRRASELSNGMKQRVGIARAFAIAPKLLLLDEPFGMLDALTRWELQEVLMDVWSQSGLTAIMVTHDVDEAILLADRVVMMTNGPRATIGQTLSIKLPRPRSRKALLGHAAYYELRESLLTFLARCDHH